MNSKSLLLDTHTVVWLLEGSPSLGRNARAICDGALNDGEVWISTVSIYELGVLIGRGRLTDLRPLEQWRENIRAVGIVERPLDGALAARAAALQDFHYDPADRMIIGTALAGGLALVTADRKILHWNGRLERIDAQR
jgi:PIN domain nuclease of toxin-antitoxin system